MTRWAWVGGVVLLGLLPGAPSISLAAVDRSPQWIALLHRGRVDSPAFYLAPEGKPKDEKDYLIELQALVNHPDPKSMRCRFPARVRFLERHGFHFPQAECKDLEEWKQTLDATSVSFLFAGAYPKSPASLFGHTFLRLNSKKNEKNPVLNYAVNFAAVTADEFPIVYAWKGITGGYQARFSLAPFYEKLNEYVYAESRDIWEYELDFTPAETEFLIEHLWELTTQAGYHYFYFDENCSFQVLALLEAIRPELNLTSEMGYVLPLRTLQKLNERKIFKSRIFHPSLRERMLTTFENLTSPERQSVLSLLDASGSIEPGHASAYYDAVIQALFYKKQRQKGVLSEPDQNLFRQTLVHRSRAGESTQKIAPQEPTPPETAHGSYRIRAGFGAENKDFFQSLELRPGIRDLLSPSAGYSPLTEVEFLRAKVKYIYDTQEIELAEADLFRAQSLFARDDLEKGVSWKLRLGWGRSSFGHCEECRAFIFSGGVGFSWSFFSDHLTIASMAIGDTETAGSLGQFRFAPGLEQTVFLPVTQNWKTLIRAKVLAESLQGKGMTTVVEFESAIYFLHNIDLRAGAGLWFPEKAWLAETALSFYF